MFVPIRKIVVKVAQETLRWFFIDFHEFSESLKSKQELLKTKSIIFLRIDFIGQIVVNLHEVFVGNDDQVALWLGSAP